MQKFIRQIILVEQLLISFYKSRIFWLYLQYLGKNFSISVHLEFNCKVMLYCRHDTRDELQEEEQTIFDTGLTPVSLYLINHTLHHCGVVAWVNAKLVVWKFGVRLKRHRLFRVISHYVLEHLVLRQQRAVFRITLEP